MAVCTLLTIGGCGGARRPGVHRAERTPSLQWVVSSAAVSQLLSLNGAAAFVRHALDGPWTLVVGMPDRATQSWSVRWAASATSLAGVAAILNGPDTQHWSAVLLDQEDWPFTPLQERMNPAPYVRQAASDAHAHHVMLMATPGTDLVHAMQPSFHGRVYAEFLALGIAREIAPYADAYDIQAQGAEANVPEYAAFVQAVAAQLKAANPKIIIFSGLSTNPSGQHVTAAELEADVAATRTVVAGYWLNIPSGGVYCPACGQARPEVALALLRALYGGGGASGTPSSSHQA